MNTHLLMLYRLVIKFIPETRGFALKRFILRKCGAKIGDNVRICSSAFIIGAGNLEIGDNTWVGHRCLISSSSSIVIGRDCDIAPDVYIGTGTHIITPECDRIGNIESSQDIVIGNGCWLAVRSIILPCVSIADKCVIAAGSVVTKDVTEPLVLIAGVPGTIKKRLICSEQ